MLYHVQVGDRLIPAVNHPSDPFRTKGQHPQCQPRVRPEVLEKARKQFFVSHFDGVEQE